jgi:hypothetical protein
MDEDVFESQVKETERSFEEEDVLKLNILVSFEVNTTDISYEDNFKKLLCNGTLALVKVLNKFYIFFYTEG